MPSLFELKTGDMTIKGMVSQLYHDAEPQPDCYYIFSIEGDYEQDFRYDRESKSIIFDEEMYNPKEYPLPSDGAVFRPVP